MAKSKAFATPRALAALAQRASRHPDPKERDTAAAILYLFIMERERGTASQSGGRATAKKSRLRTALARGLAKQFRHHGVPDDDLIETIRDAWAKHPAVVACGLTKPVPDAKTIGTYLKE